MTPISDGSLGIPKSPVDIERSHRERKRLAVERAMASPYMRQRLSGIDPAKLDDTEMWARIPVLTKDELRKLPLEDFYSEFCVGVDKAVEFWRSGGATGKPLFYPRSQTDMDHMMGVAFRRIWTCIGATAADRLHVSFPLGIHPVGQLAARSAEMEGLATIWAGAGNTTPSANQIELILSLGATIVAAMPSYALHLANVAEAEGIDLANSAVRKLLVSAEPLTAAKRAKLERVWGADVYNSFGMTEGAMTSVERDGLGAMIAWSDLFVLEVIDASSGKLLGPGQEGMLVMTPIWSNEITPFLRWQTGDIVTLQPQAPSEDPFSVFPILDHRLRTEGFFKVRGVNVNHGDFEDFMFGVSAVTDFKADVIATDGNDLMRVYIELKRGAVGAAAESELAAAIKRTFEITPEITALEPGSIAREFERSVKAPRFIDRRDTT